MAEDADRVDVLAAVTIALEDSDFETLADEVAALEKVHHLLHEHLSTTGDQG
ncbi:MAG TPA: hypothetical protein VK030_04420 [Actinomycetales bacterium]|nr:hypothetical protein [Actinomycetales bacterium]